LQQPNTRDQLVLVPVFEMAAREEQVNRLGAGGGDSPSSLQERRRDSTGAISESPREDGRSTGWEDAGKGRRDAPGASANEERPRGVSDDEVVPDYHGDYVGACDAGRDRAQLREGCPHALVQVRDTARPLQGMGLDECKTIELSGFDSNKLQSTIQKHQDEELSASITL
jgi:hypothetical protein